MGCWLWCSPRSDGMQFNRSSNEICGSIPSLERRTDKARIYSASKGMVPGSRLVVLLDVDKNPFAQITGTISTRPSLSRSRMIFPGFGFSSGPNSRMRSKTSRSVTMAAEVASSWRSEIPASRRNSAGAGKKLLLSEWRLSARMHCSGVISAMIAR